MKVKINGQEKDLNGSSTLKKAIEQFSKDTSRIIAEVNGKIIKGNQWEQTFINDGDTIELVSFVGGG